MGGRIMENWEKLFEILQVLNPESDMFKVRTMTEDTSKPHFLKTEADFEIDTERWEDICYYMDTIKPKEEE
jgi:hypothetical protein